MREPGSSVTEMVWTPCSCEMFPTQSVTLKCPSALEGAGTAAGTTGLSEGPVCVCQDFRQFAAVIGSCVSGGAQERQRSHRYRQSNPSAEKSTGMINVINGCRCVRHMHVLGVQSSGCSCSPLQ